MKLIKVVPKILLIKVVPKITEKDFGCQIFCTSSALEKQNKPNKQTKPKAIISNLIQAAGNVFYQHLRHVTGVFWDLAVLACTQALRIVWRSPSRGILSLDCISVFWRIFPNNFLFDLPNVPLVLLLFSSPSLLALLCQRALGAITELECGLFSKLLHPWKHFAGHHSTHSAVFLKSLFSWDPKKTSTPWLLRKLGRYLQPWAVG